MPELPEVEITRRGLAAHLTGMTVVGVIIRNPRLRWPIPAGLAKRLRGQPIHTLGRRGKYLLVEFTSGTLIIHLGMSGSLRVLPADTPPEKHDHFDLLLEKGTLMRLRDPRRFGAVLWHYGDAQTHPLLAGLGREPLEENFDAAFLYQTTRGRNIAIKQLIMNSHVVVGIGNIYANEALFRAGIRPQCQAGKLSRPHCAHLVEAIRDTLNEAIHHGGSSLRDYVGVSGQPGYFQQRYWVYGRAGEACRQCGLPIKIIRQGQRASFYCGTCQK